VTTAKATKLAIEARSICIHGDGPNAPGLLSAVRKVLDEEGVRLAAAA
jgi:UPF0271 protein